MSSRKVLVAVFACVLFPLIFSGTSFATGLRISIDNQSSTLNEGSSEIITVTLNEPIICEEEDVTCNVVLNYTSSDPASINMSGSSITWTTSNWYVPMQIDVTALAPSSCATSETDTISATAVSNAAYYNNFQSSFSITVNSQPPYTSPDVANDTVNIINNGTAVNTNVIDGVSGCPDPNSLSIISGPTHGSAVDPTGSITYTPNANYSGTDSLVYSVCSLLDNTVCSSATLTYDITGNTTTAIGPNSPDTGYGVPTSRGIMYLYVAAVSASFLAAGIIIVSRSQVKR